MRECGSGGVLQRQIVLFKTEGIAINMGKQGKPLKTLASGEPDAMAGSGAKRGRDGAASSAAAKAAEVSGDDRFSLSKFQLDERFANRKKVAVAAKAAAELEMSDEEEEEEEEEFGDDGSDDMDDDDDDDDGKDGNYDISEDDDVHGDEEENGGGLEGEVDGDGAADGSSAKLKKNAKKLKPMSPEELAAFMKEQERRGVVYLSRIPPYMKPTKVRHLLQKFGEIGRIYLTPEDSAVTKRRRKMGGNKRVKYEDGWVEFMDKKKARQVAVMLNGQPMGSKNRGFFEHDLWTMKYLSKFKWRHLTEKLAYDREVQRQRAQAELMQGKKERDAYVAAVHKARASEAIRKRKAKKSGVQSTVSESQQQQDRLSAQFRQRATVPAKGAGGGVSQSILSRVFQS